MSSSYLSCTISGLMEWVVERSLYKMVEIGDGSIGSSVAVFGKIEVAHIRTDVLDAKSGTVSFEKLRPIGRIGGNDYSLSSEYCTVPRPAL